MKEYKGKLHTKYYSLIPLLLGVSKSNVNDDANVYALHITPWFEVGINIRK